MARKKILVKADNRNERVIAVILLPGLGQEGILS